MLAQPGVAELAEERYLAPMPDIPKLLQYPEGPLGSAYATDIKTCGFDPDRWRESVGS
jgi:ubiquinone biosynthesis protein Coq4